MAGAGADIEVVLPVVGDIFLAVEIDIVERINHKAVYAGPSHMFANAVHLKPNAPMWVRHPHNLYPGFLNNMIKKRITGSAGNKILDRSMASNCNVYGNGYPEVAERDKADLR